jgi:hypothetical protein
MCPPLWDRAPIGLAELIERASLQTRVDRKYVLPARDLAALLVDAGPDVRVLEIDGNRTFAYESVYFDTDDLVSYRLTAHRRRRRFKVRTRTYLDSYQCWLEVKSQGSRQSTVKNRQPYEPTCRDTIEPGRWYVDAVLAKMSVPGHDRMAFAPTLITRYRRSTLYLPATDSRVTIDTDLTWEGADCRRLELPELAVVETKTGSTPSHVDRTLWARGHRPIRISKYATGLAAMRPDLPATPWQRTLRRYFTPAGRPVAPTALRWLPAS